MTGIKAGEQVVVPESEAVELRAQVKRLQQLLGEKAEDLAVLKDAVGALPHEVPSFAFTHPAGVTAGVQT